jgi:hypothetical protein
VKVQNVCESYSIVSHIQAIIMMKRDGGKRIIVQMADAESHLCTLSDAPGW